MKKFTKILVLLLSVALILGAIAVAVSAENDTAGVFGVDITEELSAGGTYTLSGDSCVTDTVVVTNDLVVDLNGFSLSAACDVFKVDTGVNLTVIGNGNVYLIGAKLVDSAAPDETKGINVTVKGTSARGINIVHSGSAPTIVSATVGSYTFDHVSVRSTAEYSTDKRDFFANGANAVGANWTFNYVDFYCDTAINATLPSSTSSPDNASHFVEVTGTEGSATIKNSTIKNGGNVVQIANAAKDSGSVIITVENSTLECLPVSPGARTYVFDGGWKATASGAIVVYDSELSAGYNVIQTAGNSPGNNEGYVDKVSLEIHDTILRHYGVGNDVTDNGAVTGCPSITAYGNSVIYGTGTVTARSSKLYASVGTRSNINLNNQKLFDEDGVAIALSTKIAVVYDPMGSAGAPFLVVAKEEASSYLPIPTWGTIQNFENNLDKPNDAQFRENKANGTSFLSTSTVEGNKLSNLVYNTIKGSAPSYQTGNWWNLTGNFGVIKNTENNYLQYYIPGTVGSTVDVNNVNASTGKSASPCLEFRSNATKNTSDFKVAVLGIDLATSSGSYVEGALGIHARTSSDLSNYAISISANGTITFPGGVTYNMPTNGDWTSLMCVIYPDATVDSSFGAASGAVYWYVNGELIHTDKSIARKIDSSLTIHGLRLNVKTAQKAGTSMLLDNWSGAFYDNYNFEGEGIGKHMPEKYAHSGNFGTSVAKPVATLENKEYYSFDDVLKASERSDFDIVLADNVSAVVVTETRKVIWTNGYEMTIGEGSTSASAVYDNFGNAVAYIFDPVYDKYKVTFAYFTGDINDVEQVTSLDYYDQVTYSIGQIPSHELVDDTLVYSHKEGQTVYAISQVGWGDVYGNLGETVDGSVVTLDAQAPLSAEFCQKYNGDVLPKFPVFDARPVNDGNFLVVATDGTIRMKATLSSVWNSQFVDPSKQNAILLADGETVIINGEGFSLCGAIAAGVKNAVEGTTRTINFDMNGYTVIHDPTAGASDAGAFFDVVSNDAINFYSSVPGAVVDMRGAYTSKGIIASGNAFSVLADRAYDSVIKGEGATPENVVANGQGENANVTLNIGKCTDLDGNTTDGSNLTFYTETLFTAYAGNASSTINVDGVKIVRNGESATALVYHQLYNGTVNLKNVDVVSLHDGSVISGGGHSEHAHETINIDGCNFVGTDPETSFINSSIGIDAINITNSVIGYTVKSTADTCVVTLGGGNTVYAIDEEAVAIAENVLVVGCDEAMTFGAGSYKKLNGTAAAGGTDSNKSYTFTFTTFRFVEEGEDGDATLPRLTVKTLAEDSDEIVEITFVDFNGETLLVVPYVKGTAVTAPEGITMDGIAGSPIAYVFAGEWENLPETAEQSVTVTPKKAPVANIDKTELLYNLSLYSDFAINFYVPVVADYTLKGITFAGEALDITKTVTFDGVKYVQVAAGRNVTEVGVAAEFVVTVEVDGIEAKETIALSIIDYAKAVIEGNYDAEMKDLMKYIIKYAAAANEYFDTPDENVSSMVTEIGGEEKNYVAMTGEQSDAIATVFSGAAVDLSGNAPAFKFTVKADYEGTVTVNGVEYNVKGGDVIVLDNVKAYDFLADITIVAGETTATFNYGFYAASMYETNADDAELLALIDALYEYATASAVCK